MFLSCQGLLPHISVYEDCAGLTESLLVNEVLFM